MAPYVNFRFLSAFAVVLSAFDKSSSESVWLIIPVTISFICNFFMCSKLSFRNQLGRRSCMAIQIDFPLIPNRAVQAKWPSDSSLTVSNHLPYYQRWHLPQPKPIHLHSATREQRRYTFVGGNLWVDIFVVCMTLRNKYYTGQISKTRMTTPYD